jgi:hypothetical protein
MNCLTKTAVDVEYPEADQEEDVAVAGVLMTLTPKHMAMKDAGPDVFTLTAEEKQRRIAQRAAVEAFVPSSSSSSSSSSSGSGRSRIRTTTRSSSRRERGGLSLKSAMDEEGEGGVSDVESTGATTDETDSVKNDDVDNDSHLIRPHKGERGDVEETLGGVSGHHVTPIRTRKRMMPPAIDTDLGYGHVSPGTGSGSGICAARELTTWGGASSAPGDLGSIWGKEKRRRSMSTLADIADHLVSHRSARTTPYSNYDLQFAPWPVVTDDAIKDAIKMNQAESAATRANPV